MEKFFKFLENLEQKKIYYKLAKVSESVLVEIAVPGQRWEVEFLKDGGIQVEKFVSDGSILDEESLLELLEQFGD